MSSPRKVRGHDVLVRFWINVEADSGPSSAHYSALGYGVTAYDRKDALDLLRERVFGGALPRIESLAENVDVSALDEGHILPNMEPPSFRGVWFPRGFAEPSG